MIKKSILALFVAAFSCNASQSAFAAENIASPDGNVIVNFDLKNGAPVYSVDYKGKPIILESRLGLELDSENGRNSFADGISSGTDNVDRLSLFYCCRRATERH